MNQLIKSKEHTLRPYGVNLTFLFLFFTNLSFANNCSGYKLFDKQQLIDGPTTILEADASSITDKNIIKLDGQALVTSSDYAVNADQIYIDREKKYSKSLGNVYFNDINLLVKTDLLEITKKNEQNNIKTTFADYSLPEEKIRGNADSIHANSDLKNFTNAKYTRCPLGDESWSIYADSIELNSIINRGNASNAVLNMHGIPIIYSPSVEWVLEGKGSGFLAPTFSTYTDYSSSDKGYFSSIPYFYDIAPDRDLLLSLNHLSTRGVSFSQKYRQLLYPNEYHKNGRYENEFSLLLDDKVDNKNRWYIRNFFDVKLNKNSTLEALHEKVSDRNYFRDVALEGNHREKLTSYLKFNSSNNYDIGFYAEDIQTVNLGSEEYIKKPEVFFRKKYETSPNESLYLNATFSNFDHKDNSYIDGNRQLLNFKYEKKLGDLAYEFSPSITSYNSFYDLSNKKNISRSILGLKLDSKLFLEREFDLFDKGIVQTLNPFISYFYIPKHKQTEIPNFDTSANSDSFDSLFKLNNFTGSDKISSQNSFLIGFESDFFNETSGETYLSLKTGQKYLLDKQIIDIDGNITNSIYSSRGYSDIHSLVEAKIGNSTLSLENAFDPDSQKFISTKAIYKNFSSAKDFYNLSFVDDQSSSSANFSGSESFDNNSHVFWGINRNLDTNINDRITLGLAIENCCIGYRFALFKKHLSENHFSYERAFEIVFKGLSSTTPVLKNKIKSEIPDYIGSLDDF